MEWKKTTTTTDDDEESTTEYNHFIFILQTERIHNHWFGGIHMH